MNKKELAEIKKNFNENSGLFTINQILSAYIDAGKNVYCKSNRLFSLIPEDEGAVILETLKKVLSGSIGKGLIEYSFPNEAYEEGGSQNTLYKLLNTKLKDETATDSFLSLIAENIEYESAFAVVSGLCTYSIITKNKNDELSENADYEYNFVVTAICPVNTGSDGLVIDRDNNSIFKKSNTEMLISRTPADGFLYPVFSDRCPDINHVMYFTKTPNKPNISIVNNVLGCEFVMSAQIEKEKFQQVVEAVAGDELDYTVITKVNEKVLEFVEQNKHETEIAVIDDKKLYHILSDSGISEEKLEGLSTVYKETIGNNALTASNLTENKTVVATPEITVNIKNGSADKIRTSVINGRRCLVIDLDDPCITINGISASVDVSETAELSNTAV